MKVIRTVRGDIDPANLGITAPHEHLWCDQGLAKNGQGFGFPIISEKMYMFDKELITSELKEFYQNGGRAVAEMTTDGWGRDVEVLKALSEATGIHVVAISGTYVEDCLEPYVAEMDIDQLAERFAGEVNHGVGTTGIKTGLLKASVSRRRIEGLEEKGARAVARAQLLTGAAITTHTTAGSRFEIDGGNIGRYHLDLFESEGVDLSKVIVGHTDENADIRQLAELISRGAYIQFDTIGKTHWLLDETRISLLMLLMERGMEDHVLLSTDRCRVSETKTHGGPGYSHVLTNFIPKLREAGFDQDAINKVLIENPARVLAIETAGRV